MLTELVEEDEPLPLQCRSARDLRWRTILGVGGVAALAMVVYVLTSTLLDADATSYGSTDPDALKIRRQQSRGTVASILVSLTFGILNYLVDKFGHIDPATSTALVGMVFGGTLGFLMDNTLGSDNGFRLLREQGALAGWKYALGQMATGAYLRYTLTVLLDMFVSLILFKPLFGQLQTFPYLRCHDALANGLASTIIGLTTFQAYANVTRFAWAYPATDSQTKRSWIRGSTMQVVVSVAGVVFLASNTQSTPGELGINHPQVKLWVVLGSMCLIWFLTKQKHMNPPLEYEVVPNNLFTVTATTAKTKPLEVGATVSSNLLAEVSQPPQDLGDDESYTVLAVDTSSSAPNGPVYRVQRVTPAQKYKKGSTLTTPQIVQRAWMGSILLSVLGAACFGATILGTSRLSWPRRAAIFSAFQGLALALAVPGWA